MADQWNWNATHKKSCYSLYACTSSWYGRTRGEGMTKMALLDKRRGPWSDCPPPYRHWTPSVCVCVPVHKITHECGEGSTKLNTHGQKGWPSTIIKFLVLIRFWTLIHCRITSLSLTLQDTADDFRTLSSMCHTVIGRFLTWWLVRQMTLAKGQMQHVWVLSQIWITPDIRWIHFLDPDQNSGKSRKN